jgi:acyl-CoA dehydrogenase
MFDFKLSDEQKQYKQLANEFAQNEIAPRAHEIDQNGEFPQNIVQMAFELGLVNVLVEEEFGGLGLTVLDACVIAEELGRACAGIGITILANDFAQAPLLVAGSDKQKETYLKPMTKELSFAAGGFFNCEQALSYEAVADSYVINGRLKRVSNATLAKWFCLLAYAKDSGDATIFIVPKDAVGVTVASSKPTLGLLADSACEVNFVNVSATKDNVIGQLGDGLSIAQMAMARLYPLWAALSIGVAASALASSTKYAQERIAFGKPIADNQAIAFMLADMAKDIQAARLLTWQAAWLADNAKASDASQKAMIAHAQATQTAMKTAIDAVQIFGGYGYSKEYPVEKLMRDAKMLQIYPSDTRQEFAEIGKSLAVFA